MNRRCKTCAFWDETRTFRHDRTLRACREGPEVFWKAGDDWCGRHQLADRLPSAMDRKPSA